MWGFRVWEEHVEPPISDDLLLPRVCVRRRRVQGASDLPTDPSLQSAKGTFPRTFPRRAPS